MTLTVYGIRNCDTVKKALAWLEAEGVEYLFHDYKKQGVDGGRLRHWVDKLGWEALLNRSGTTFRKLPEAERSVSDADGAIDVMLAYPSAIRRPVVEAGATLLVGFKPERYRAALGGA
ncbi:MAG TPA: ArsC family reductase [Allosphingosinicella sp.]|jgi:arsenate reductase